MVTHRDHFVIGFNYQELHKNISEFRDLTISDKIISDQYDLNDTRDWKLNFKRQSLAANSSWEDFFTTCLYRPFDLRYYYHHQDVVEYPRNEIMRNMIEPSNLALIVCRQQKSIGFQHCFVTNCIGEGNNISIHSRERSYHFPLYTHPNTENNQTNIFVKREPNLSQQFLEAIKIKLGYEPIPEAIFYYAYAIFHSPTYRQRYAEFLKIDFPRLPLTSNPDLFKALAAEGEKIVNLHLLKAEQLQNLITRYEGEGENQVAEVRYNESQQRVYINKQQYFVGITNDIWQFKIGGYQVLEKWLKDRKKANRHLSPEDVLHYQKIVVALNETQNIMNNIDMIIPHFPIA